MTKFPCVMSLLAFIIDWKSENAVGWWAGVFDYSGALDFVVALILLLVLFKRPEAPTERIWQVACGILALFAGFGWVMDSKLNHRLSFLQEQHAAKTMGDLQSQLHTVGDLAEAGLPGNLPISSMEGDAQFVIAKEYASVFKESLGKTGIVELYPEIEPSPFHFPPSGALAHARIIWATPNPNGETTILVEFTGSNMRTVGPGPAVTPNNLYAVRFNPFSDKPTHFETKQGWVHLSVNSMFDVEFRVPNQTNDMPGIIGFREREPSWESFRRVPPAK